MKRYRVSLALKVLSNFEAEVSATNEKMALEKVLKKYHDNNFDENNITNPDWNNAELDINEDSEIGDIDNGIFIKEIR